MIKACKQFVKANAGNYVLTIYNDNNMSLRDSQDDTLLRGLGEYKKSELVESSDTRLKFKFWETQETIYEIPKQFTFQFFHDFHNDGDNIVSNNCYNEDVYISETVLEDNKLLINYLMSHFNLEVRSLIDKANKKEDSQIVFDGECFDIIVDGNVYPIFLMTEI